MAERVWSLPHAYTFITIASVAASTITRRALGTAFTSPRYRHSMKWHSGRAVLRHVVAVSGGPGWDRTVDVKRTPVRCTVNPH